MIHRLRNGDPMVTLPCREGRCEECREFVRELGNEVVCHCDCHPQCEAPGCMRPRVHRKRVRDICTDCWTQRSLDGTCNC